MPPRSSLTSPFSATDAANEVVCPLRNNDGSSCRKRCVGEKRYRSMQEHIRRAHPEHYISKLPATEESFALMISTPPSEKPRQQPQQPPQPSAPRSTFPPDRRAFYDNRSSSPATPRTSDEYPSHSLLPAASAAAALAQLHNHRMDSDWDSEPETSFSDNEAHRRGIASSIELPPINHIGQERMFGGQHYDPTKPRQLLPSILSRSPPGRSSTLPPFQRQPSKSNRPRKSSVTQNARKPRHEKKSSREHIRRMSYDRKAFSAEPSGAALGKRWEDLIDAATSATEEPTDEDRTPVPPSPPPQHNPHRASLPPFPTVQPQFQSQSYQASPLQHALTPPSYAPDAGPEPFPSVESSGENFHIGNRGLEGSMSPAPPRGSVEHYCAACRRLSVLGESYACTECICGVCRDCLDALTSPLVASLGGGLGASRPCPKCKAVGGRWRPFQLDFR